MWCLGEKSRPQFLRAGCVGHGVRYHVEWTSHRQRVAVLEAMADDIVWNGEPIDGMSAADAATLEAVHSERLTS